jgi:hypothetical protein
MGDLTNVPFTEVPFSLDWLLGAAQKPKEVLSVCPRGHLVVNENTHWAPARFSNDRRALWCRMATDEEQR